VNSGVDTDAEMGGPNPDPQVEVYSGAGKTWGIGKTFMNQFDEDEYAAERARNPYFPFACKPDWETAAFLLRSDLSMVNIDEYLEFKSPVRSGLLPLFGGNRTKTGLWIPTISKDRNRTGKDRVFRLRAVLGPVATSPRPVRTAQYLSNGGLILSNG